LGATYRGLPLLQHAVLRVAEVTREVIVVVAPGVTPPMMPPGIDVRIVHDASAHEGPLEGLLAGLEAADSDLALAIGGDMPELSTAVAMEMLRVAANDRSVEAVTLHDGDRFRPLPMVVRVAPGRQAAHGLRHGGERRLRSLPDALRNAVVDEATWHALDAERSTLWDIDEPGDLAGRIRVVTPHVQPLKIGDVEFIVMCQGFAPLALSQECPGQRVDWGAERRRHPWAFHGDDSWPWHVHAFAVRRSAGTVMVDTGLGSFPPFRPWASSHPAEQAYRGAGVDPTEVETVVLTHLHADHAGGGLLADGGPRFPDARYVVHPADWAFFEGSDDHEDYVARHALDRVDELGMLDLAEGDREIAPGISVVHTPGHTPGHRSVTVDTGAGTVLLTGDLIHLPIQAANPTWPSSHDEDPQRGLASRASLLAQARDEAWTIGVPHFAEPFGILSTHWVGASRPS
jgi:glyoxylase-like metal-dependent hydrolase (beta-lactamase superfamily II)/molybdopterin-guanine dinucleotide biosynthesis protein A